MMGALETHGRSTEYRALSCGRPLPGPRWGSRPVPRRPHQRSCQTQSWCVRTEETSLLLLVSSLPGHRIREGARGRPAPFAVGSLCHWKLRWGETYLLRQRYCLRYILKIFPSFSFWAYSFTYVTGLIMLLQIKINITWGKGSVQLQCRSEETIRCANRAPENQGSVVIAFQFQASGGY